MVVNMYKILFVVFLIVISLSKSYGAGISSINILSEWKGLGVPQKSTLLITRIKGKYYEDKTEVPLDLINAFEKSILAPEINKLSLETLGVDQNWLTENAQQAFGEFMNNSNNSNNSPNIRQKELFIRKFQDLSLMQRIIVTPRRAVWTDDYPSIEITVTREGKEVIKISSSVQTAYMLPWTMNIKNKQLTTYNAEIGRAVLNLLPSNTINYKRLRGDTFKREIARTLIYSYLREEWEKLKDIN
jgi:hypothetical protein